MIRLASSVPSTRYHLLRNPPVGGSPYDTQGTHKKSAHGPGHSPADTHHFADIPLPRSHENGAGTEKKCYLPECVHGNMQHAPGDPFGGQKSHPQNDVRQLADGGKSQHSFEVILAQRYEGCHDDRHRCDGADHHPQVELSQQLGSEYSGQNTDDTENPPPLQRLLHATAHSRGVGATIAAGSHP